MQHKDPSLKHNEPSLRHKSQSLIHNDVTLRHQAGSAARELVGSTNYLVRESAFDGAPRFGRYTFTSGWFKTTLLEAGGNDVLFGASDGGTVPNSDTLINVRFNGAGDLKARHAATSYIDGPTTDSLALGSLLSTLAAGGLPGNNGLVGHSGITFLDNWTHIAMFTDNGNDWNDPINGDNNDPSQLIVYVNGVGIDNGATLSGTLEYGDCEPFQNFQSGQTPDTMYAQKFGIGVEVVNALYDNVRTFCTGSLGGMFADFLFHAWEADDDPGFDPDATVASLYNGGVAPLLGDGGSRFWTQPLVLYTDEGGYTTTDNLGTGGDFDVSGVGTL